MGYFLTVISAILLAISIAVAGLAIDLGVAAEMVIFLRFFMIFALFGITIIPIAKVSYGVIKKYFVKNIPFSIIILLQTFCYISSIKLIPVSLATVIFYTYPILTYVIQVARRHEALTVSHSLALCLGIVGVYLTMDLSQLNLSLLGIALAFGAAMGQASLGVFSEDYMKEISSKNMLFIAGLQITLVLPIVFISKPEIYTWVTPGSMYALLATASFAIGILLFYKAVTLIRASRASVMMFLEPGVTILLAIILLNESIGIRQVIGLVFIVATSVMIMVTPQKKPTVPPPSPS